MQFTINCYYYSIRLKLEIEENAFICNLRKCFWKNHFIKISKIVKYFKKTDFTCRTIYNTLIRIAYCNSIKCKKKTDRLSSSL